MMEYILPGVLGLLLGLTLRWTRLSQPGELRAALALRPRHSLRSLLYFIGAGMAMTARLMWLAVIVVDFIVPLPLSAGALLGGAVFGVAAAQSGFTPLTAICGVGSGHAAEALCTVSGCLAGALLLPLLEEPLSALQSAPPYAAATLFAVTLDEPYLLGGGFLAQGCAGLLLMAIAACIPSNRRASDDVLREAGASDALLSEATPEDTPDVLSPDPPALPEPPSPLLLPAPAEAPEPQEETFIALLPGEEPLVVDTGLEDAEDEVPQDTDAADPGSS